MPDDFFYCHSTDKMKVSCAFSVTHLDQIIESHMLDDVAGAAWDVPKRLECSENAPKDHLKRYRSNLVYSLEQRKA